MLTDDYVLSQTQGMLTFQWFAPSLPLAWRWLGIVVLFGAGAGLVFQKRIPWEKLPFRASAGWIRAILAAVMAAALGLILLARSSKQALVEWRLSDQDIALQSPNGSVRMAWTDVQEARFDPREKNPDTTSLVLVDNQGREAWLVLKWLLVSEHRARLFDWLRAHLPPEKIKLDGPTVKRLSGL
jgi:hypothetical protein